jgi:hypothetical protein
MGYDTYGRPHKRLLIINKWREREREREERRGRREERECLPTRTHAAGSCPFAFADFIIIIIIKSGDVHPNIPVVARGPRFCSLVLFLHPCIISS